MKKLKFQRSLSVMLLLAILASASCGEGVEDDSAETTAQDTTAAVETLPYGYVYPEENYNGYEFSFLNTATQSWANVAIAPEEMNGDLINDALYQRNERIGSRYNVKIKEYNIAMGELANSLRQNVSAGDDAYDTYIVPLHLASGVLTEEYLVDLSDVSTLNIDKPWWDQRVNDGLRIGGKLYLTASDISLFPFEATWIIYFNEDIMTDAGLELPYQLVRDGKWTLDKLTEYAKAAAVLNGDDSFKPFNTDGNARYGLSTHTLLPSLVHSAGSSFAGIKDGKAYFEADSERMLTLYEKVTQLTQSEGAYYDRDAGYPTTVDVFGEFRNKRFMMIIETLGYISRMRDMDMNFGVLPLPKFDENQESYHGMIANWGSGMTGIASTASDTRRTGIILDALAYDSYLNLMEPYYDTHLTRKGLRNEDSVDMLKIIRETRGVATDVIFGWTSGLSGSLTYSVRIGSDNIVSTIASNKNKILEAINNTLQKFSD